MVRRDESDAGGPSLPLCRPSHTLGDRDVDPLLRWYRLLTAAIICHGGVSQPPLPDSYADTPPAPTPPPTPPPVPSPPTCPFSLSPEVRMVPMNGGERSVNVKTEPGC